MNMRAVMLYGTEEPTPEQRIFRAGPVTATFESGQLRWIKIGSAEAIRGIAFVVRDRSWGTPVPEISDFKVSKQAGGFRVAFTATCRTADGSFTWRGDITGKPNGTIRFAASGSPEQDFVTGRTGFVILHPLEGFVGKPVAIEHTDGSIEKTTVPEAIDPAQPFFLVRAMTHSPMRGVRATVRMEGDSWETEDHRNWTDASFKTYSRPLSLPYPYTIKACEVVRQHVTLTFEGKLPQPRAREEDAVSITLGSARGRMPDVGLSVLPEDAEEAAGSADIVKAAGVQHLNCRLDLRDAHWRRPIAAYRGLAKRTGAEIVLEIILPDTDAPERELGRVATALKEVGLRPAAVIATQAADLKSYPPGTPMPPGLASSEEIATAARTAFPRARIGGGMLSNFTELNRKRPPKKPFDFVSHATSGLVHAADDRSVMETLEAIGHIIRSTRQMIGRTPYRIGPAHIGNSFNPYGTSYAENPEGRRLTMARVDPRHRGLFGAAWHLGYLSQAAAGGLEAATLASPVGEFGIAYRRLSHAQPWFDDQPDARVYPVFHVVRGIAKAAGAKRVSTESSDTGRVRALAWKDGNTTRIWLANLRESAVEIRLKHLPKSKLQVWRLDESSFARAAADISFGETTEVLGGHRLTLESFAVARVDASR